MLLSIEVPDVDALLPRVETLGGTATSGANDMHWGQRVAHIKDPGGKVVNLTQQLRPGGPTYVTPGARRPAGVPGAYEADEGDQERGKAVKPGT